MPLFVFKFMYMWNVCYWDSRLCVLEDEVKGWCWELRINNLLCVLS